MGSDTRPEILRAIEASGYTGYKGTKYTFNTGDSTGSLKKAIEMLKLPTILKDQGQLELALDLATNTASYENTIRECLQSIRSMAIQKLISSDADPKSTAEFVAKIKTLEVYRSATKMPGGFGQVILYNPATNEILHPSQWSYETILPILGLSEQEILRDPDMPLCIVKFDPRKKDRVFKEYASPFGAPLSCINLASPPAWRTKHSEGIEPKFHGFIRELFEHLFPDENERELVLDWFHYALVSRNGTVLVLVGDRGTGKSTVIDILGELVGREYYEVVSQSALDDKFNSQFKNRRLLKFEEVGITQPSHLNKIKAWCNDRISYESKGEDAVSIENFSSIAFLLNEVDELKIGATERRFSIPQIAKDNLLKKIPADVITKFREAIDQQTQEGLDLLAEFGYFLENRVPKLGPHEPIKGVSYWRVADLNLTEWEHYLRDYIAKNGVAGEFIHINDVFPMRNGKTDPPSAPRKMERYQSFLMGYRYFGKYRIADCVKEPLNYYAEKENASGPKKFRPGLTGESKRSYGFIPLAEFINAVRGENLL